MVNIAAFKTKLLDRRAELEDRMEKLEDVLDDPKSTGFSEHATESELDEVYESQGRSDLKEVRAIDAALKRIEKGTFGICSTCGEAISEERLEAVPHAALCRNCMK